MKNALKEIVSGFSSLVTGMRITLGQFFKPTITVHYPHETLKIPARYRGHIELVRDPGTGRPLCIACKLCEKACPSDCITVEGAKLEGAKKRSVTSYKLDFTKCSLCGSCIEACHDDAIRFSREYNLAGLEKEEFMMDLLQRLQAEAAAAGQVVTIPTPAAAPASAAPLGAPASVPACSEGQQPAGRAAGAPSASPSAPASPASPAPAPAAQAPVAQSPKMELPKPEAAPVPVGSGGGGAGA